MNTNTLPLGTANHAGSQTGAAGPPDIAGCTDVGRARQVNEDSYLIASFQRTIDILEASTPEQQSLGSSGQSTGTLLMVADGMGGHGGGDIASRSAVTAITDYLVNVVPCATAMVESLPNDARSSLHGLRSKLASALLIGDEAIREKSKSGHTANMGTTLTLAFVMRPSLYIAHVGDSRCYLLREGQLLQLTNDHTLANQMAKLQGRELDESTQLNHILWNCLGGGDDIRPTPEVFKVELRPDDLVMLCTDGLTNELKEHQIAEVLQSDAPSQQICERLVELANAAGGADNITVVVMKPPRGG